MIFINLPPSCNPARPDSTPTSNLRCTLAALLAVSVLRPSDAASLFPQRPGCAGVIEARHQKIVHRLQVVALRLLASGFGVQGFAGQGAVRLLAQPDKLGPAGGHGHILLPDAQGLPSVFQLHPRIIGLVAKGLLEVGQLVLGLLLAQALGFEAGSAAPAVEQGHGGLQGLTAVGPRSLAPGVEVGRRVKLRRGGQRVQGLGPERERHRSARG